MPRYEVTEELIAASAAARGRARLGGQGRPGRDHRRPAERAARDHVAVPDPGRTMTALEPDPAEAHALGAATLGLTERLLAARASAPSWDLDGAGELARELADAAPPEAPRPVEDVLGVIEAATAKSYNNPGPGFMAYIPGGALYTGGAGRIDLLHCQPVHGHGGRGARLRGDGGQRPALDVPRVRPAGKRVSHYDGRLAGHLLCARDGGGMPGSGEDLRLTRRCKCPRGPHSVDESGAAWPGRSPRGLRRDRRPPTMRMDPARSLKFIVQLAVVLGDGSFNVTWPARPPGCRTGAADRHRVGEIEDVTGEGDMSVRTKAWTRPTAATQLARNGGPSRLL